MSTPRVVGRFRRSWTQIVPETLSSPGWEMKQAMMIAPIHLTMLERLHAAQSMLFGRYNTYRSDQHLLLQSSCDASSRLGYDVDQSTRKRSSPVDVRMI